MDAAMIGELTQVAGRLGRDPAVRVVCADRQWAGSFCAGGDLEGGCAAADGRRRRDAGAGGGGALAGMLGAIDTMPKPLIGAGAGAVPFGGGVGLMSVCDVAGGGWDKRQDRADPRCGWGLIPATIGPYVVARIGRCPGAAGCFSRGGRVFGAGGGRWSWALLARAVPEDALDAAGGGGDRALSERRAGGGWRRASGWWRT